MNIAISVEKQKFNKKIKIFKKKKRHEFLHLYMLTFFFFLKKFKNFSELVLPILRVITGTM